MANRNRENWIAKIEKIVGGNWEDHNCAQRTAENNGKYFIMQYCTSEGTSAYITVCDKNTLTLTAKAKIKKNENPTKVIATFKEIGWKF